MPRCDTRTHLLRAALAWAAWGCFLGRVCASSLPARIANQRPRHRFPPPSSRIPAAAPVPDSEELPAPRLAAPGAATSQPAVPLEVIEFRDVALQDAMRLLSQQTGLNIVPSKDAGQVKVSLYLENTTAEDAVRAISQAYGLITRRDETLGITRIFTTRENQANLDAFTEEHTDVFTLLYPNATNVGRAIQNLFYGRVRVDYSGQFTDNEISTDLQDRLSRFDLINSRSLGLGYFQNGSFGNGGSIGGSVGVTAIGTGGLGGVTSVGVGGAGGVSINGVGGYGPNGVLNGLGGNVAQQPNQPTQQQGGVRNQELTTDEIQELEDALSKPGAERSAVLLDILRRRQDDHLCDGHRVA